MLIRIGNTKSICSSKEADKESVLVKTRESDCALAKKEQVSNSVAHFKKLVKVHVDWFLKLWLILKDGRKLTIGDFNGVVIIIDKSHLKYDFNPAIRSLLVRLSVR